jgi:hypothetical protein
MARKLVSQLSLFEGRKVDVYRKVDVDAVLSEKDSRIRKLQDDVQKQNLELQHCYNRINRLSVINAIYEQSERDYLGCIDDAASEIAALKEGVSLLERAQQVANETDKQRMAEYWRERLQQVTTAKLADFCEDMMHRYMEG